MEMLKETTLSKILFLNICLYIAKTQTSLTITNSYAAWLIYDSSCFLFTKLFSFILIYLLKVKNNGCWNERDIISARVPFIFASATIGKEKHHIYYDTLCMVVLYLIINIILYTF